jgi:hypothetical protein
MAMVCAGGGAAAIEIPVPQPERDHVRRPDHRAGGQQPSAIVRKDLVVGHDDVADEPTRGEAVQDQ